jgi:hypothetical protein
MMTRFMLSPPVVLSLLLVAVAPAAAQDEKPVYKLGLVLDSDKRNRDLGADVVNAATRAFVDSRRFEMVERSQLNAVFTEKNLQKFLGKGDNKLSDLHGIDFIGIVGYTVENKRTSNGNQSLFTIEVRLSDTRTGNILATLTSERSDYLNLPSSPREAGHQLFQNIREAFPPFGYIVKVSGEEVVVDLGTEAGVKKGDTFEIVKEGEQIIHPRTGEPLPAEMIVVGELKVVSTSAQLSHCKLKSRDAEAALGDPVRFKGKSSILNKTLRKTRGFWDNITD